MISSVRGYAESIPDDREIREKTVAVPSEIAQNLKAAEEDSASRYDEAASNLVAQKPVLAYILKSALDEYTEYTVQEIAERFIEGKPEIRSTAVHQDHPDREEESPQADTSVMMSGDNKVEGLPAEDKSYRDGTIYYDIRFLAILPKSRELIEIIVNVEVQNNDKPGYPIPKRGVYYASRMISSQRGTIFKDQEYAKIKKVVSIWICEGTADFRSDTINRYSIAEECLRGNFHEDKESYDLMTVVVLRLGNKGAGSENSAIRLLSKMFSQEMSYEEKINSLQNEFKIRVTRELSEEVLKVCNLSTGVYNKGYDSGYDTGISAGELKKARESTYNFYDMGLPVEKIAQGINVGVETVQKWLADREAMLVK